MDLRLCLASPALYFDAAETHPTASVPQPQTLVRRFHSSVPALQADPECAALRSLALRIGKQISLGFLELCFSESAPPLPASAFQAEGELICRDLANRLR